MMSSPQSRSGTFPKVIFSRDPTGFEPDLTWDLNAMIAYLKFVDPDCKLPRDEQFIAKYYKKKAPEELAQAINEEKRLCMRKLYFRLVNPDYRLPSRKEFEEFMRGPQASTEDISLKTDDQLLEEALASDKPSEPVSAS